MLAVIILAVVQGIAEFLPISSSAHLIIFRDVFGIGSSLGEHLTFTFDIALHLGTLLAIVVYFNKDFLNIFIKGITKGYKDSDGKILYLIIVATIPGAIAGFLFEDVIDRFIRGNLIIISLALIIMGIIIYAIDKKASLLKKIKDISLVNAFLIGCAQVFALIPGFSRSGTTIAASRSLGLDRENSAKFSFYLSVPIVLGAVILTLLKENTITIVLDNLNIFLTGILISFIAGLLCIEFLLKYLKKNDFRIFMWYRIIIASIVLISLIF